MSRDSKNRLKLRGLDLTWAVHRQPQWCTVDGWKGLAILVALHEGTGRQLIVELPFERSDHRSTPHRQRPKMNAKLLAPQVEAALLAGWVPTARGKPFVFFAEMPNPSVEATNCSKLQFAPHLER